MVHGNLDTWVPGNFGTSEFGNSGTWKLGYLGSWILGNFCNQELGRLGTWEIGKLGTWALGHLGTWVNDYLGTCAFRQLGFWVNTPCKDKIVSNKIWNIGVAMATPTYPSNALPERRIAWSHAILALQPYYQYAYRALIRGGTEEQLL